MGFGQGLSGLKGASQKLDVIGNNIANSGTVGFKSSSVSFADVYASSRVGLGTQVAAVNQNFSVGTISTTGGQFDMAIDGAAGLFRVVDTNGNVLYTRNGEFHENKEGYIVNAQGQYLTGYVGGSTTPEPLRVPSGNIAPQPTSSVTVKANFDGSASPANLTPETLGILWEDNTVDPGNPIPHYFRFDGANYEWVDASGAGVSAPASPIVSSGVSINLDGSGQPTDPALTGANFDGYVASVPMPFDPAVPDSYTHSLPITVYDSLGKSHQLSQYFVKRDGISGESVWEVHYRMDGAPIAAPAAPVELRFDKGGRLLSPMGPQAIQITLGGGASPAENLNINVDYAGSTQFQGAFTPDFLQNGFPTGEYSSMSIGPNGQIVASYTNGEVQEMGYLVLANFKNLQGLQPVGGNAWRETSESGQPILGTPGSNGMALIKGQAVEESNVDMGTELVNMIITQRTYQANAQTITTQSEMLQTLINIR